MPRVLKRPPPRQVKPGPDPSMHKNLEKIEGYTRAIRDLQSQAAELALLRRVEMATAKAKGASLRQIGAAAELAPQTILNQLDSQTA